MASTFSCLFPRRIGWRIVNGGVRISSYALVHERHGQPENVVMLQERQLPSLGPQDILVDFMYSPINPADINKIQGTYAEKPALPAVCGNEGVARVREVGGAVQDLKPDDLVIPAVTGIGTWQTKAVFPSSSLTKISSQVPLQMASMLLVNPTTAYRMLKDFVHLKEGDCVIQNGANSAVGQFVIQLSAKWNITTINIVRERPNIEELVSQLIKLGASTVVMDTQLSREHMDPIFKEFGTPSLGFNCVGGKATTDLIQLLKPGATLVTYGGMSRKPLTIPTGSLIFSDIKFVGYWNSRWIQSNLNNVCYRNMIEELSDWAIARDLLPPPTAESDISTYQETLKRAMTSKSDVKQLFKLST